MSLSTQRPSSFFGEAFFNSTETYIHPTAFVDPRAHLGLGVKVGPFCTIIGNVTIGDGTRLYAYVAVGFPAQVLGIKESLGTIHIGKNCEIREFASIGASRYETGTTRIGDNCYIMNYCHVGHDAILEDNVTLINNVNLGGHTYVERNAILMANSATHQFCRVGKFAALAPYSGIRQDLPPFGLFSGQPAQFSGLNAVGLKRAGFSRDSINALKYIAKLFYQDKLMLEKIKELIALQPYALDEHVQEFIQFIEKSTRGVSRRALHEQTPEISHQEQSSI